MILFIGIGSNLGERISFLRYALNEVSSRIGVVLRQSSVYETAAWGKENQGAFLNQVLSVNTVLTPDEVLYELLQIEKKAGRTREVYWGPRTLDLDILAYGDFVIDNENLKVPHPRIQERNFVLVPWREIASEWIHPIGKKTIEQMAMECPDSLPVKLWINH